MLETEGAIGKVGREEGGNAGDIFNPLRVEVATRWLSVACCRGLRRQADPDGGGITVGFPPQETLLPGNQLFGFLPNRVWVCLVSSLVLAHEEALGCSPCVRPSRPPVSQQTFRKTSSKPISVV